MQIVSPAAMRLIDSKTVDAYGCPSLLLMENAGRSMADWVRAHFPQTTGVLVVCGSGNNGGDGLVLARHLHCAGCRVAVVFVPGTSPPTPDTAANLALAEKYGIPMQTVTTREGLISRHPVPGWLLVDALLGTGLTGPVTGFKADVIAWINAAEKTVLSLDVPSGFQCAHDVLQTGTVRADFTLTVALLKTGMLELLGQPPLGQVAILGAGFPPALLADNAQTDIWVDTGYARRLLPERPRDAHKKIMGCVLVAAGSRRYPGAAVLAARGTAAGGAGLVRLALPAGVAPVLPPWIIPVPLPADDGFFSAAAADELRQEAPGADAFLLGPGLGREGDTAAFAENLLTDLPLPAVIDADALYHLARLLEKNPRWQPAVPVVLTPHPGELHRLLGGAPGDEAAVAALAARTGTVIAAKGRITRIFTSAGTVCRVASGHPALARGGTGDVLAGLIAACLGRGMDPLAAAALGVFLHGAAGSLLAKKKGEDGLLPEMIAATIPRLRRKLSTAPDGAPSLSAPSLLWPLPEVSHVR